MWLHLFVVFILNLVEAELQSYELDKLGSFDSRLLARNRVNVLFPELRFLARHSWNLKSPTVLKLSKAKSDHQLSYYIGNNLWKETTTEASVQLKSMFSLSEHDNVGDYIEYLTRTKVLTRNAKEIKAIDVFVRTNYSHNDITSTTLSSMMTSPNSDVTKYTNKSEGFTHLTHLLPIDITKRKKRYRRKSIEAKDIDSDFKSKEAEKDKNETADEAFLIQGITTKKPTQITNNTIESIIMNNAIQNITTEIPILGAPTKNPIRGVTTKIPIQGFTRKNLIQGVTTKITKQGLTRKNPIKSVTTKNPKQSITTDNLIQGFTTEDLIQDYTTEDLIQGFSTENLLLQDVTTMYPTRSITTKTTTQSIIEKNLKSGTMKNRIQGDTKTNRVLGITRKNPIQIITKKNPIVSTTTKDPIRGIIITIKNHTTSGMSKQTGDNIELRHTILKYWGKKMNENLENPQKRFKIRSNSRINFTVDAENLKAVQIESKKSSAFPIKSDKLVVDSKVDFNFSKDMESNTDRNSKTFSKKSLVHENNSKELTSLEDPKKLPINKIQANVLMKTLDSETLNRLFKTMPWHEAHVDKNTVEAINGTNLDSNVTIMIRDSKLKENPLKFVVSKNDLNNADAILIVFHNSTEKNESKVNNEDVPGEQNNNGTTYTKKNLHYKKEHIIGINNHTESKYKMSKKIIFNWDKKRKSKLFTDNDLPNRLNSQVMFLNKISKSNIAKQKFVNNSNYYLKRALNEEYNSTSMDNSQGKHPTLDNQGAKFIYISPSWDSNTIKKSRRARSSGFNRRYRNPNKFRIMVKPTKRHNKLGQVSVHIIRDFEPLEDVSGSLRKYFEIPSSTGKKSENHSRVNKNLNTWQNTISNNSVMVVGETEKKLSSYLGLNNILLRKVAREYNNSKSKDSFKTKKYHKLSKKLPDYKRTHLLKKNNIDDDIFSNLLQDIGYNSNAHQRVKRSSLPSPPKKSAREVKHITENRRDHINTKLYFSNNIFPNLKFYKAKNISPRYIDQDIYKTYNRLLELSSRLNKIDISVKARHKKFYSHLRGVKKTPSTALKKSFDFRIHKSSPFIKQDIKMDSLNNNFQKSYIRSANAMNSVPSTTETKYINKNTNEMSSNVYKTDPITPPSKESISRFMYSPTNHTFQRPNSNMYKKKQATVDPQGNIDFKASQHVTSRVPKLSRNYDNITTRKVDAIKNSKKRELADSLFFKQYADGIIEANTMNGHEDTFNADIGDVAQVGMYEQLGSSEQSDLNVQPLSYADILINARKGKSYSTNHELKDTVWPQSKTQLILSKNVPKNSKHDHSTEELEHVDINVPKTEKVKISGYINLSTARKLYSDLDPLNPVESEDYIPQVENNHGAKNREILHLHSGPQLDDYNDEILEDPSVGANRVGVDYINYNYGDDLSGHRKGEFDKYEGFEGEFLSSDQILPRQNIKEAKHILPKVRGWHKLVPYLHSNYISDDDLYKYFSSVKKQKHVRTFEKTTSSKPVLHDESIKSDLSPRDVINKYYEYEDQRKKTMRLHDKNKTTNNKNKTESQYRVYMHVPTTPGPRVADEILKNVKVYVHTFTPTIKPKENILHSSNHLIGMWSKNHVPHIKNSIISGVPPLGIWTYKNREIVRPVEMVVEQPSPVEEEFDRRKRDTKSRSQLICCLMKRPDQQELVAHVKATWGRRCDVIVLITTKDSKKNDWEFMNFGIGFIYGLHYKDADWILKADIDSYVVIENLKYMVQEYDPNLPLYFGMLGQSDCSNFVLSKGAIKVLVTNSKGVQACRDFPEDGIDYCLDYLGVKAVDSRDKLGRSRFYSSSPLKCDQDSIKSWSDQAVAFKNVDYQDMYTLDYLVYRIQPYSGPKAVLTKVNNLRVVMEKMRDVTHPPRSKAFLTENHVSPFKYLDKLNDTLKAVELNDMKDKVTQLKELSALKLF